MYSFIVAFLITAIVGLFIIRHTHLHSHFSGDFQPGPQKMHVGVIPRIGGVAIYCGLIAAVLVLGMQFGFRQAKLPLILFAISLPAFLSGLAEDLLKMIPPWVRLLCALFAAGLGYFILHAQIERLGIGALTELVRYWPIGLFITVVAVAGLTHAVNIIDGFNGLSAGVCLLALFAISYV
ncbi:MAG: MraY family glycosyltransferase, partial [Candidatus Saccharimonadales bacterium]